MFLLGTADDKFLELISSSVNRLFESNEDAYFLPERPDYEGAKTASYRY